MPSTNYVISKIKTIIQLADKNTTSNFSFYIESEGREPFLMALVHEKDMYNDAYDYKKIDNGYIKGKLHLKNSEDTPLYLILKAEKEIRCEVFTGEFNSITQTNNSVKYSNNKFKPFFVIFALLLTSLIIVYFYISSSSQYSKKEQPFLNQDRYKYSFSDKINSEREDAELKSLIKSKTLKNTNEFFSKPHEEQERQEQERQEQERQEQEIKKQSFLSKISVFENHTI